MTELKKKVARTTRGLIHEAGKTREIVVIMKPPNILAFRAKGCRKEYTLTAEACYIMAVRAHVRDEKKQKEKTKQKRRNNHGHRKYQY